MGYYPVKTQCVSLVIINQWSLSKAVYSCDNNNK